MYTYNLRSRKRANFVNDYHDYHEFEQEKNEYEMKKEQEYGENLKCIIPEQTWKNKFRTFFTMLLNFPVTHITLLSIASRLYMINENRIVVWDEAHFGKFANRYINREFYFDVHPPLGKLLIAMFGWMFSYDGSFEFLSGSDYTKNVPIGKMRAACAIFGSFIAPLMYGVSRNLGMKKEISILVAFMVIFDNALLTISKFVLLDPILLMFTALSLFCATKFSSLKESPFNREWIFWLAATGISLGLTSSVKWVGLFTYSFVGVITTKDLWSLLRIAPTQPRNYLKHWTYRIIFLIILPIAVYMFTFIIHFSVLERSGPGDAQMSSRFQSRLKGNKIEKGPAFISYGSTITMRNKGYGSGLLHSHQAKYPEGSKQGQVTLYPHRDLNNYWVLEKIRNKNIDGNTHDKEDEDEDKNKDENLFIHDSDIVRLRHNATNRNLHSHTVPAPMSKEDYEVSGYGTNISGDDNDYWIVEIMNKNQNHVTEHLIEPLDTIFRLRHKNIGCYLSGTSRKLPEWGFSQKETVCTFDKTSRRTYWNIEDHIGKDVGEILGEALNSRTETRAFTRIITDFFSDFVDLNMAMWYGNNALVPKPGEKNPLVSTVTQWPLMDVGLRMCNWRNETLKHYLIGNPFVWWTGTISIIFFCISASLLCIKRQMKQNLSKTDEQFIEDGTVLTIGWLLHYVPFGIMGRVLYVHHYFPSLIMSLLVSGWVLDKYLTVKSQLFSTVLIATYGSVFFYFSPLSYGFIGEHDKMSGRIWRDGWNI